MPRRGPPGSRILAMSKQILINAAPWETRAALLEDTTLVELHIERRGERGVAGNIYKGKVVRVLPGMQAAFVDIGLEKAGFLHVSDLAAPEELPPEVVHEVVQEAAQDVVPTDGLGDAGVEVVEIAIASSRRARPVLRPIEERLQKGQEILTQVSKEPMGSKGARITSHVSIAGRHLVLTPWSKRVGVSRRIDSDRERRRLRGVVSRIRPKDLGFIIRTAGKGTTEPDLEADVRYLTSAWDEVQVRKEELRAPAELHRELSLPLRVLRDFANSRTKRIVVDDDETFSQMQNFLERFVADPKPQLEQLFADSLYSRELVRLHIGSHVPFQLQHRG